MNFDYEEIFDTELYIPYPPFSLLIYFLLFMAIIIGISNIVTVIKETIYLFKNPQKEN